jgi:hypothetical protein
MSTAPRTAHKLLAAIANKCRDSDLRMDHPEVKTLVNDLLAEIEELKRNLDTAVTANNHMRAARREPPRHPVVSGA